MLSPGFTGLTQRVSRRRWIAPAGIAQSVSIAHGAQLDIYSQPEGGLDISLILRA